ncbi:MAG: glycosyl transferase [Gammaproteobacteria bacterium]|nr:MAG: glycosyl transferase [Pseudomonadota bacterium]PIE38240.1 MAG: glycosyl transferase [Gammaproteobacteria bacterium]
MKDDTFKIMLVSRNLPPLTGGMEQLVFNLWKGLRTRFSITVIGPKGCSDCLSDTESLEAPLKPTPLFVFAAFILGLFSSVKKGKPDCYLGGSGLVAPVVVTLSWLFSARSVVLIHGLDIVANNSVYQTLFLPFIRKCDLLIANSDNTRKLAIQAGVAPERITVINPGVQIPHVSIPSDAAKRTLNLTGKALLLSVGRLVPRKGISEFIDRCMPDLVGHIPDIHLAIVGEEPLQALNKNRYSEKNKIGQIVKQRGLKAHVSLYGKVSDEELDDLYSAADVFIFPLIDTPGDVEGFGMVALEAAAHNVPTVAFNVGGVSDAISQESGILVTPLDYDQFSSRIQELLAGIKKHDCLKFARQSTWESYHAKSIDAINTLINKQDRKPS